MAKAQIVIDDYVKQLICMLLRKHAREHSDFGRYNNISDRLSFDTANAGLRAFGYTPENPAPEKTK